MAGASSAYRSIAITNRKLTLLCLLCAGVLVALLYRGVAVPSSMRFLAAAVASLAGAVQVLSFAQRPYHAALIGSGRQATFNLITAGRTLTAAALAFVLLEKKGVMAIPIAEVILQCAAFFVFMGAAQRLKVSQLLTPLTTNAGTTRRLVRFGGLVTLGGFAWTIESTSDTIILASIAGPEAVAAYALWWRFPQMVFTLCTQLTTSAFPEFAHQAGASPERAALLFQKLAYSVAGLATLALIGICLWLPSFINIWLSGRYDLPFGRSLATMMALLVFLRIMGNSFSMFWIAFHGAAFTTRVAIVQAFVKVSLALFLGHLGMVALVSASCIAAMLQGVGIGFALLRKGQLDRSFLFRLAALTVLAFLIGNSVKGIETDNAALLACGIVATAGIWGLIFAAVMHRSEAAPELTKRILRTRTYALRVFAGASTVSKDEPPTCL